MTTTWTVGHHRPGHHPARGDMTVHPDLATAVESLCDLLAAHLGPDPDDRFDRYLMTTLRADYDDGDIAATSGWWDTTSDGVAWWVARSDLVDTLVTEVDRWVSSTDDLLRDLTSPTTD